MQSEIPIHPSSLTRWLQSLKPEGIEKIISGTIKKALKVGQTKPQDLSEVIADITVQEKEIEHLLDRKLIYKALEKLVSSAKDQEE